LQGNVYGQVTKHMCALFCDKNISVVKGS
jgi:hypothetical protein